MAAVLSPQYSNHLCKLQVPTIHLTVLTRISVAVLELLLVVEMRKIELFIYFLTQSRGGNFLLLF